MPDETPVLTLDTRGLACPLPILKAKKALKSLAAGETLLVLATDAGAPQDFVVYCGLSGDELCGTSLEGGVHRILIRKAAAAAG